MFVDCFQSACGFFNSDALPTFSGDSVSMLPEDSLAADDKAISASATPDIQPAKPPTEKDTSVQKSTAPSGTLMRKSGSF